MTLRKPAWLVLCGVLVIALALAACLTPLIFAANTWLTTILPIHQYPADRIFRRLATITGFFAVLYYQWRIRRQPLASLGWRRRSGWLRQAGQGTAMGAVMFCGLMGLLVWAGAAAWRWEPGAAIQALAFVPGALCIGLLEETFFRGLVLQTLLRDYSQTLSVILTSVVYAVIHFLKQWQTPLAILPDLVGLFLFGLVLATAYLRTGLLYLSCGLHTSLAFLVKTDRHVLEYLGREPLWLFGNERLITGVLGWAALVALWAVVWILTTSSHALPDPPYRRVTSQM